MYINKSNSVYKVKNCQFWMNEWVGCRGAKVVSSSVNEYGSTLKDYRIVCYDHAMLLIYAGILLLKNLCI